MTDILGLEAIPEEFASVVEWAKRYKDGVVIDAGPDDPGDIRPRVAFYRDDVEVAEGLALQVNRDEGLDMAEIGARVFDADRIEVLLDCHMTDQAFIDRYGRIPDPHELQDLCDNEGACDLGLTTDCIMIGVVERGGRAERVTALGQAGLSPRLVMINLPYHVDRRMEVLPARLAKATKGDEREHIKREGTTYTKVTRTCHWQDAKIWVIDDDRREDHPKVEGLVPDTLRAIMEQKTLADVMTEVDADPASFGLTAEEARLHQDIAGTRILAQLGFAVALAGTEESMAVIKESMARYDHVDMIDPKTGKTLPKTGEPDPENALMDLFFEIQRRQMVEARDRRHADELATRERNRAERAAGQS